MNSLLGVLEKNLEVERLPSFIMESLTDNSEGGSEEKNGEKSVSRGAEGSQESLQDNHRRV